MRGRLLVVCGCALAFFLSEVRAQDGDIAKLKYKTTKLAEGVYLLEGGGGNIVASAGADGTFIIDDDIRPLTPKLQAAVKAITPKPVRFILNTHWHPDHTGGNEGYGKRGAVIVAHENVRKRLSEKQFVALMNKEVPPSPAAALPIVTFSADIAFHLNGEEIRVFHVEPAHTDGDSVVWLKNANLVHMGDTLMTISYPFVDVDSGGRYDGFIAAADRVLAMIDDKTKVVPGHGQITDKAGLTRWRDMLVEIRARVKKEADAGKSLDQIKAAKLTAEWDDAWGKMFINPAQIVEFAYGSVKTPTK